MLSRVIDAITDTTDGASDDYPNLVAVNEELSQYYADLLLVRALASDMKSPIPCPFCHHEAHHIKGDRATRQSDIVTCGGCSATIEGDHTPGSALRKWNNPFANNRKSPPDRFHFLVTVSGCDEQQARQVMSERIACDEDYGFPYTIDYSPK